MTDTETLDTFHARGSLPEDWPQGPAVILVDPQMGENIGMVARAMLNCGLTDLRLVRPRDGWPNPAAVASCSGALLVIENARVFETTEQAVSDLNYVMATTARPRDMVKDVFTPGAAGETLKQRHDHGETCGLLFGCEKFGLVNDDVALSHAVITIPLNPGFSSLNLSQAVLLTAYAWMQQIDGTAGHARPTGNSKSATMEDLTGLYERLEDALQKQDFFRSPDMKPSTIRNIRNMLARADMTDQEVRTMHGIISALIRERID